jgi:hypothetical protein
MEKGEIIDKNRRVYIREYFKNSQSFNDGDIIEFEMPPMCSGDYSAVVYLDSDGDPYVDNMDSFFKSCRDYVIKPGVEKKGIDDIVFTYSEVGDIVDEVFNLGMSLRQDQIFGSTCMSGVEVIKEYMEKLKLKKV